MRFPGAIVGLLYMYLEPGEPGQGVIVGRREVDLIPSYNNVSWMYLVPM